MAKNQYEKKTEVEKKSTYNKDWYANTNEVNTFARAYDEKENLDKDRIFEIYEKPFHYDNERKIMIYEDKQNKEGIYSNSKENVTKQEYEKLKENE